MSDAALAQFTEITGSAPRVAQQYLQLTDNDLESAMQLYFENGGNELQTEQPATPAPAPAPRSTSTGRPRRTAGYEDQDGVVHLDSDDDDVDYQDTTGFDDDDDDATTIPVRTTRDRERTASRPPASFDNDLEMARRLQEELYREGGASDTVRAPLARTTETLVGPDADYGYGETYDSEVLRRMRERSARSRPGIFNQRDPASPWAADPTPSSHTSLSRATGGASDASSKSNMLAEMYRRPFELMTKVPFDVARDQGREKEKWLLVDVQDPSVFDCQLLNRDLWKNPGVKETVQEHFIFLQYLKDEPIGAQYIQYYFPGFDVQDNYPHIAIIDPRTGERMKVWSGPPVVKPTDFLIQLHEFLDRYSLNHNVRNPVAKRKPEVAPEARIDTMTEEEMLEMAMRNSLEGAPQAQRRYEDPDDLTRSVGDIKGKGRADEDVEMETNGHHEEQEEEPEEESPFRSIPSDRPHVEPPADPATTTRIQFRHPSGRVIRRFALSDPVQRLYEWLKTSPLEGKEGVDFELVSMGQNLIKMLDTTVQDAGLKNGTVMVGFLEEE